MFASYRPSGMTSKQESGHCSQQSVHLMHFSKSTTGRMERFEHPAAGLPYPALLDELVRGAHW